MDPINNGNNIMKQFGDHNVTDHAFDILTKVYAQGDLGIVKAYEQEMDDSLEDFKTFDGILDHVNDMGGVAFLIDRGWVVKSIDDFRAGKYLFYIP